MSSWNDFLLSVDADNSEKTPDWLSSLVGLFTDVGLTRPQQLCGAKYEDFENANKLALNQRMFLRRALAAASDEFGRSAGSSVASVLAVTQALGGGAVQPRVPTLRTADRLGAVSLAGAPGHLLPPQAVMDEIQKDGKDQTVSAPFPYGDFRKCLPAWALLGTPLPDKPEVVLTDTAAALAKTLGLPTGPKKEPLSLQQWGAAYPRWAATAVAAGQITFWQQASYHDVVMEVAHKLKARNIPPSVATS